MPIVAISPEPSPVRLGALAELTIIPAEMPDSSRLEQVRNRLPAGGSRIRTLSPSLRKAAVQRCATLDSASFGQRKRAPILEGDQKFESGFLQR